MDIDGILLIDKPEGLTSFQVCDIVKKKFKFKKVGHGGTLDPFATGLLVIGINKGTKVLHLFSESVKEYEGEMVLGEQRDTFDVTGNVINKKEFSHIDKELVYSSVKDFIGTIEQTPPAFSALKHKGKPLYEYARKGINIKKKPRIVFIEKFEIKDINLPEIKFYIKCSKGTYIRSIANDFGIKLNSFAYLKSLRRVKVAHFSVASAAKIENFEFNNIIHISNAFNFKKLYLKPEYNKLLKNGNFIKFNYIENFLDAVDNEKVYLIGDNIEAIGTVCLKEKYIKPDFLYNSKYQS